MTTTARVATAVGLYQASEDMWDYFDKVLLIDGGECCYFGPTKLAVQYFKDLGFEMPERSTSADFLTSVSSEHQRRIRPGFENWIPRSPRDFAAAYRASEQRQLNHMDIAYFEAKLYNMMERRMSAQSSATETKNYALPYWKQVVVLAHRQALVLKGDPQTLGMSNSHRLPGTLLTSIKLESGVESCLKLSLSDHCSLICRKHLKAYSYVEGCSSLCSFSMLSSL
jgi:hypothetical protein